MTAIAIAAISVAALAVGALVYLAVRLPSSLASERASMADANIARREKLDEQRLREAAEAERDEARAHAAKAEAERDEARQKLGIATVELIRVRLELTAQIKAQLENGTDEQAAAIVNDLLKLPLSPPKES